MRMITLWLVTFVILWGTALYAQTGNIKGRVIENSNGEPMIGVVALIKELPGKAAVTDIDGNYMISAVPEGTYIVEFQTVGYKKTRLKVTVRAGQTADINVSMGFVVAKEIVVVGRRITNTAASLLKIRKRAAATQDAISSEQIKKSPDSDAGDAAKRVTGVTVLGGKYIYIRGLSERYTNVLINGAQVSTPLPNKRVVPLNIFPAGLIDNLVISKTYVPYLPADFGGGTITINTKSYPENEELKVGLGMSYNSQTTGKDFYTFKGGKFDSLGYDDGTYVLPPLIDQSKVPLVQASGFSEGYTLEQLSLLRKNFTNTHELETKTALPSGKISFAYGNSYTLDERTGKKLGFFISTDQKTKFESVEGKYKRYSSAVIEAEYDYKGSKMTTNTTAQLALAFSPNRNNELKLSSFFTHNSEKTGRYREGLLGASRLGSEEILQVIFTNQVFSQLKGRHFLKGLLDSQLEWFGAFSWSSRNQPDTRTAYRDQDGNIYKTEPFRRYFNKFDEFSYEFAPWITIPFKQWSGQKSKFRFGSGYSLKTRNNDSRRFLYLTPLVGSALDAIDNTGSFSTLFEQGNYFAKENTGTTVASGFDSYAGKLDIISGYAMVDIPLVARWVRLVTGVRVENWKQTVDSFNRFNRSVKEISEIGDTDFIPSVNLILSVTNNTNIRFAYSNTINRPDFLEASNFRYYDDLETGATIKGNPDLDKATMDNYDVRIEWFPGVGEVVAVSGFYKKLDSPIEVAINDTGGDQFYTFYNQSGAENFGAEVELRKKFGFISKALEALSFYVNYTYIRSKIKLDPSTGTSELAKSRPLQGQSPWVVNTGFFYDNVDWGTTASLLFNKFGRRIIEVTTTPTVDHIYEESYPKLDAAVSQKAGILTIKLTVENLLNPKIDRTQNIDGKDELVKTFRNGIDVGVSASAFF